MHRKAINLVEIDSVLSDGQVVADTFSNYFKDIVKSLLTLIKDVKNFPRNKANGFNWNLLDSIEAAISKYKNRPS